uniref:RNA-directed RNA polymerase n=1 Tax=Angiostrongylus cantonensis TaxID=6313 RepID=A0A158P6Z2_ANGCA
MYQYQVTVAKMSSRNICGVKNREQVRDIFWQCVRRNEDFFGPFNEITFDDCASAFSINQWKFRNGENEKFEWRCSSSNKRVTLTVSYVSDFEFDINAEDVAQRNLSAIVVKSLVSQHARYFVAEDDSDWAFINRWQFCSGSLYYIPRISTDPKVYVDAGVRAWFGVYNSVKVLQDRGPALCFGLVNRLFYELDMGLVEFFCEVLNEAGLYRHGDSSFKNIIREMAMNQTQRNKINSLLQGARLRTSEALLPDRFPYLPLCEVGKGMLLPLEVNKFFDINITIKILENISGVSREPHQHKQLVEDIFSMIRFDIADTVNFLNAFKVEIIPEMIQCHGTVLNPPVSIDKEGNELPMTPERAIKRKKVYRELVSSINAFKQQFFKDMVGKCRERGMHMASVPLRVYHNITIDGFEDCIEDATKRFFKLQLEAGDRNMEKLLLMIVINNRTYLGNKYANGLNSYGFIKAVCDNKYGIASQVVDASTVIKATSTETKYDEQTVYYNIALKINAKLGGINQTVIFDDDSRLLD